LGIKFSDTGNLGIGTTSPGGSLDVYGTTGAKVRIGYFTDNSADDPQLRMADGKATRPGYSFTNDLDTGMWRPAADSLSFQTGTTEAIRIISTGNVGIGTTGPSTILAVVQTSATDPIADAWTVYSSPALEKEHPTS